MTRLSVLACAALMSAAPTFATGEVYCEAPGASDVMFAFGFGRVPGLAVLSATIRAEGKHWSTVEADGAIPIIVAQGANTNMHTLIDFADPQFENIVASARLYTVLEGSDRVTVGTLHLPGVGVYPLICS